MAMTLASPSASPSPATTNVKNEAAANNNTTTNDNTTPASAPVDTSASTTNTNAAAAANNANIKRKPSRRANTAERRATHNAVERQRRETLNGRFLDLAQLLPNLSQIRRPSKSSIVNSSIAHIHASRRHRMLASRELRQLRGEADALRREVNEWRSRQNLPLVDEPVRSDGFNIIVSGELDVLVAEMGAEMAAQGHGNLVGIGGNGLMDVEEDEDLDDWGPGPHSSHGGPPPPGSAGGYPGPGGQYDEEVFVPQPPVHAHHPAAVHQGMMMNGGGHPQHHPHAQQQHHAQHPQHPMHHQQHVPHPHHMAQGGHPFGYHPSQTGQFPDEERGYAKNTGNPFAHNINTRYDSPNGPTTGPGALFTPPATRDGPPPNGVPGLTSSASNASGKGGMNINTNVGGIVVNGGGASPAHSVQSVHSGHSPASHHSGIAMGGAPHPLDGHTPPPPSAISQHFSARSGSGSPVGSYELASGGGPAGVQQPTMERRATYPGPPQGMMYAGPGAPQEMYGGHPGMPSHDMHPQQQQQRGMQGGHMGHDMREMRGHPMGHGHGEMRGEMRGHHEMRGQQMVGAGAGGGLFGMML